MFFWATRVRILARSPCNVARAAFGAWQQAHLAGKRADDLGRLKRGMRLFQSLGQVLDLGTVDFGHVRVDIGEVGRDIRHADLPFDLFALQRAKPTCREFLGGSYRQDP